MTSLPIAAERRGRMLRLLSAATVIATAGVTPAGAVEADGTATVLSDYRFRGVSLSDRQPVVEAGVDVAGDAWFAGVEAISASHDRGPNPSRDRHAEIDASAGWSRAFGLLTPSVGVIGYFHPGGGETVGEAFASLEGALGPGTITVGANYAPGQAAAPGGSLYTFVRAAAGIPGTPVRLHVTAGREAGALDGGRVKADWSGGIEARILRIVTVGLDYVGNDLPATPVGRTRRNREDGIALHAGVKF